MTALNIKTISALGALAAAIIIAAVSGIKLEKSGIADAEKAAASTAPEVRTIMESFGPEGSSNPQYWLDSGAYFFASTSDIFLSGRTIQGLLPSYSPWRLLYAQTSPIDTDSGFRPQNIFRLLSRSSYENSETTAYFMIRKYNASDSPERQNYNGILIFARYEDSNNLYYGGLRVDGNAVIKKKRHGTYTTLFEVPLVSPGAYDRNTNPNVLPLDTWIPLRLSAITEDGGVKLMLYSRNGPEWVLIAEAFDPSAHQPIYSGSGGIRTDFMDAEIGGFRIEAR